MREYIELQEKHRYLWDNYYRLLDHKYVMYSKYLVTKSDDAPVTIALQRHLAELVAKYGKPTLNDFTAMMADKIESDHKDKISIQRCPSCNKIVATPIAEQCMWCGYEWRGQNPLRSEWERNRG